MAQVKLLKIAADGISLEFGSGDDITLNSFTAGSGPVMSPTGIDMNAQDVTDLSDLVFTDPSVGTINQTAGAVIVNNIMAKERGNTITSAGDIQFGVITDAVGEVDSLVLPKLAGAPTAVPTGGEGSFLYDSSNDKLWIYTTAGWDDLSTVSSAENLEKSYIAGASGVTIRDVVYISAAGAVDPASAAAAGTAQAIGFALTTEATTDPVVVRKNGTLAGFTGLTVGARYYLSATAGLSTATIPTATGNTVVQVGYALTSAIMDIQFQSLGRRA